MLLKLNYNNNRIKNISLRKETHIFLNHIMLNFSNGIIKNKCPNNILVTFLPLFCIQSCLNNFQLSFGFTLWKVL